MSTAATIAGSGVSIGVGLLHELLLVSMRCAFGAPSTKARIVGSALNGACFSGGHQAGGGLAGSIGSTILGDSGMAFRSRVGRLLEYSDPEAEDLDACSVNETVLSEILLSDAECTVDLAYLPLLLLLLRVEPWLREADLELSNVDRP